MAYFFRKHCIGFAELYKYSLIAELLASPHSQMSSLPVFKRACLYCLSLVFCQ